MVNNLRIGSKIGLSFAFGITIFALIGISAYRDAMRSIETDRQQKRAYEFLTKLEELLSTLKDAETGQRGYILTGEERYLQPYKAALGSIDEHLQEMQKLTEGHMIQQERLERLEPLIEERLSILEAALNLRRQSGLNAAIAFIREDRGRQTMTEVRALAETMRTTETEALQDRLEAAEAANRQTINTITYGVPTSLALLGIVGLVLARNISDPLRRISSAADRLREGDLSVSVSEGDRQDEIGILSRTFNQMVVSLRESANRNEAQTWLKSNLANFTQLLQGERDLERVARLVMSRLAPLVEAQHGVFYLLDSSQDAPTLKLLSSYAYQERKHLGSEFRLGEGLVGQCALERQPILLSEVPSDYIRINSGLGEAPPLNILVLPILFEQELLGVIELASFQRFNELYLSFLNEVSESIGVVLTAIAADMRTQVLLRQAQILTEELQTQQEELQERNEELQQQAEALKASEELLTQQQEELQQSNEELQQLNEELEEKAELLEVQKREVEQKNIELEVTKLDLERKAEQLALTSKYKSEFLANMSHELRTPLNSLLILSRMLADNGDGNLTPKQIEYSRTIHAAGTDLLSLINDILDLAKIESGTMSVEIDLMRFDDLRNETTRIFQQIAIDKGLDFRIEMAEDLPDTIQTDSKRLQQVLKNLLANAFKFTEQGSVTLRIATARDGWSTDHPTLSQAECVVAFSVIDTGIGIDPAKQGVIFEAFQQADGTTSRKYGGTGLGLSISREISQLLGGQIVLSSAVGQGSTFTLYLPQIYGTIVPSAIPPGNLLMAVPPEARFPQPSPSAESSPETLALRETLPPESVPFSANLLQDDRDSLSSGDRVLLILEDDPSFAEVLRDSARQQGFKVLVALRGEVGLAMAQEFKPDAISLDLDLPQTDGWTVLDRLKRDANTRHIPVYVLSALDARQRALQQGALRYTQKPVGPDDLARVLQNIRQFLERSTRNLLVVEDNDLQRQSILELVGGGDIRTTAVSTGAEALGALRGDQFDCLVLDLGLPDMNGFELIEQIQATLAQRGLPPLPTIVYTGKDLTRAEETRLKRMTDSIILKDVRSPERLLEETSLFLHRDQANLPRPQRQILERLREADPVLVGKKALIVDDDVRNIFALTSLLEEYQMEVLFAENGRDAVGLVESNPDLDIVLMDVMMPEMDGYETTRCIRQQPQFRHLPIIALTAKAMQGDRQKCIEAGASDYIAKPVDTEQLISLLRVWLYR